MTHAQIVKIREEIMAKQKAVLDMLAAKPERDFTEEELAELRAKNAELDELASKLERAMEIDAIAERVDRPKSGGFVFPDSGGAKAAESPRVKTLGELFVRSPAYRGYSPGTKSGPAAEIDLESVVGADAARYGLKAVLTTTEYPPQVTRIPGMIITPGEQAPTIADLVSVGRTTQSAVTYMEETTTTNAAAETAEGAVKPESGLAFTERTAVVRKIATVLPVTDELLADEPAIQDYINTRLGQFVARREDQQLLTGDGVAPNLRGILNTPGIQTYAIDPINPESPADALYKAMTNVLTGSYLPVDAAVLHPTDWQKIRLLKTTDGVYLWGSPSDAGPNRIWGVNVTLTTAIPVGTALVGAFRPAAQVFRRSDITLAVSDSHSDFFARNQLAIRAEERLAFAVYRPSAFCTVTGL